MSEGDVWGGLLILLLGVMVVVRTLRGTLTNQLLNLAGSK